MSQLQNMVYTIHDRMESLKTTFPTLILQYGLPQTSPSGLLVAIDHDKTKVDEQYELAGLRKRSQVFFADIYATAPEERNNITEAIKNLFENKTLSIFDAVKQDTGDAMMSDGVRVEVDLTNRNKARAKIYLYTLVE